VRARLLDLVCDQLTALARGPLPGLELPHVLMGHEVGPDVRADLLFTLGLLHERGRREIDGIDVTDAVTRLLAGVPGKRTHTFYSYRVAETVGRFGAFDAANPVLAPLSPVQRDEVEQATDSRAWIAALDDGRLPRNYAAVLARCEDARARLGLPHDALDDLVGRVRDILGGHLDDSNTQIGRYDVYTVDIHLFCEPLAARIGEPWADGARAALDLVDRVAARDGAAVPWGRSTGILAICHTIELAGLVARNDLVDDPARWLARASDAARGLDQWFVDGWVTAHQHRSSDPYRGLDRRLQMTLDCLGKLVDASRGIDDAPADDVDLFPVRDELVWLDRDRNAAVWSFRSDATAFALPLVGASTTDYLPAPRNPGLFEVPVGSALVTGAPLVVHRGHRYTGGGLPAALDHADGTVSARYDGFPEAGHLEAGPSAFAGTRAVTWTVDGRTLRVDEHLSFETVPHGVALQVTEAAGRPLQVTFESDAPSTSATVDVGGIAEYRSCWGELARLHQIDVTPAATVHLRWSVTPVLRVVSTAAGHHYNDALYAPMADRVRVERLPHSLATNPDAIVADQLHLHWPEWLTITGVEAHAALIEGLRRVGVRIVWTQHNLVAHSKDDAVIPVYRLWARAADLVLHHSEWGRDKALAAYEYGAHTRHVVVPHGHFGRGEDVPDREGPIRLGIVGAPRVEKDVELAMRAVARCGRDDIELVVHSLAGDEDVPDDPRITAHRYEMVGRDVYDARLRQLDALVMPFDPNGDMLTTGTVGDALGFGLPTVASSWGYLVEALGDAAIVYGSSEDDLVACLRELDRDALRAAASAARARRPRHDWAVVAEQTYVELDHLGSSHH
jgi:glycosyltransferase involved in cell wall biosynthesis